MPVDKILKDHKGGNIGGERESIVGSTGLASEYETEPNRYSETVEQKRGLRLEPFMWRVIEVDGRRPRSCRICGRVGIGVSREAR